jgi:hypothetical protein
MRLTINIALFILLATVVGGEAAQRDSATKPAADSKRSPSDRPATAPTTIELRVADGVWGMASRQDVEAVLRSAAAELLQHYRGQSLPPIEVSQGGPIVLFRQHADMPVRMRLNVDGPYWAQFAFQFGHELCHVMCNYKEGYEGNQWFEESMCEVASLFVLRRMSETWVIKAPYSNWSSFAPKLADYAADRIKSAQLPKDQSLADWYRLNAATLRKNPHDRERNQVVAVALLPLLEAEPVRWAAVAHLNRALTSKPQSLTEYLQAWHGHVDEEDRPFVRKICKELGVELK